MKENSKVDDCEMSLIFDIYLLIYLYLLIYCFEDMIL